MKRISYFLVLCLALTATLLPAQDRSGGGGVFAVPVSDQMIRGELVLPGGKVVKFGAREGTMVTIRDLEKGYFLGLVPKIEEGTSDQVKFRFFRLKEWVDEEGKIAQGAYQILEATGLASPGEQIELNQDFGKIELKCQSVVTGEFPGTKLLDPRTAKPLELERLYGITSAGLCCVGCGGVTVCGSEVAGECGSCSGGGGFRSV